MSRLVWGLIAPTIATCLAAPARADWPRVELPAQVRAFSVGEQLNVDGLPMRVTGFVSADSPAHLADWFRRSLGGPAVENDIGRAKVLGRPVGDYYLTVQLEPAGTGTRGLVVLSFPAGAHEKADQERIRAERWRMRLPAGTELIGAVESVDSGKRSLHLSARNRLGSELNAEGIKHLLSEDGYRLERETVVDNARLPAQLRGGRTLYFKGPGKEAMATLAETAQGDAVLVLNTIVTLEPLK